MDLDSGEGPLVGSVHVGGVVVSLGGATRLFVAPGGGRGWLLRQCEAVGGRGQLLRN